MCGVLCVMTPGEVLMLLWCVDNWATPLKVRLKKLETSIFPFQKGLKTYNFVSTGALAFSNAHFGAGVGPIHLDNVACSGSEGSLADCPHSSFISCYNNGNAGLRCQGRVIFMCSTLARFIQLDRTTLL